MQLTLMVSLFITMCVAWPAAGADEPPVVEIWPGTAPDEIDWSGTRYHHSLRPKKIFLRIPNCTAPGALRACFQVGRTRQLSLWP